MNLKILFLEITPFATVQNKNLGKTKTYYWMNKDYIQYNLANIGNPNWPLQKKLYNIYALGVGLCTQLLNPSISSSRALKDFNPIATAMKDGYISIEKEIKNGDASLIARKEKLEKDDTILKKKREVSIKNFEEGVKKFSVCLLYTSPSPRDATLSRMPSSA